MNTQDSRHIENGSLILQDGYCDQPYVVQTPDGAWLCVTTVAQGDEGSTSEHVISLRSQNQGQSWDKPVDIEPIGPPESAYVTALVGPTGRIFVFYNHNTDNVREVVADAPWHTFYRLDSLGHFVWKYSDDGGKSWSSQRVEIPVRETRIDRNNPYGGKIRFFWHVGKPLIHRGAAYVTLHKIGRFGEGAFPHTEGWFLRSDNLLTEPDPAKIRWETLPDGDVGLCALQKTVAEEQSIVELSDGSLFCVYRTIEGHPCQAYSRDSGHTWTPPAYMTFDNGRLVKNPRAANFVWKCSKDRYLYWFHHHGDDNFDGRNPAWLCGGRETDGPDGKVLTWSEPEIALYDDDPAIRISYPDLVEENGRFFLTETQKTAARTHEIAPELLTALWGESAPPAPLWETNAPGEAALTPLPKLWRERGGFSLQLKLKFHDLTPHQTLFDSRDESGRGLHLFLTERGTLKLSLCGLLWGKDVYVTGVGLAESAWECDAGLLRAETEHQVTVIVDGGPKVVAFVVDGLLNDGGTQRTHGWGRFHAQLDDLTGADRAQIASGLRGELAALRFFDRALKVNEAALGF